MNFKTHILLLVIFALATSFMVPGPKAAKVEVNGYYKTYNDYVSHDLIKMDQGVDCDFFAGVFCVKFKRGGNAVNIKCRDIWGFVFDNKLFRDCHEKYTDYPCAVVSIGEVIYYECGSRHIDALVSHVNAEEGTETWGHACYFSKTLASEMMSVSNPDQYKKFKESYYTTCKRMIDCMDQDDGKIRSYKNCVTKFNVVPPIKKSTTVKK